MNVPLTKKRVFDSVELDLTAILGFEEHLVTDLEGAHVRTDRDDPCPRQPPAHLSGGRDDDAAEGPAFAAVAVLAHQNAVVEQLDGN